MAGQEVGLHDASVAIARAVEDGAYGVDGYLQLMKILPYIHRAELSLVLHLDIGVEGDEGLTVVEVREHVGDGFADGIVALRLDVLKALTLVELEDEELLTLVHHQTA